MSEFKEIFEEIRVSSDDPRFFSKAYTFLAKQQKKLFAKGGDNFKKVVSEEYDDLSRRLERSKFQESSSVRNVLRTRRLANLLILDSGEINSSLIPKVIKYLSSHLYFSGPERQYDGVRQNQILNALKLLQENKNIQRALNTISKPFSHKVADQIIRDTLALPSNVAITDAHAKRACLSAWLCYLRQNVGSCFATAPAIIVHDEQPLQFFKDLSELLGNGRLKRTFGGIEYAVPLSLTFGAGDLRKIILVQPENENELENLSLSPGLLAALEAIGLVESEKSLRERIDESRKIILEILKKMGNRRGPFIQISAEEVLKAIILNHLNITEKDLEEFEKRPKGMIQSGLLLQVPSGMGMGGKGEACLSFYSKFELAKNAFKSLADNALLKTWEFTLASFAETKPNFTNWNLYSSLGLQPEEKGGIGSCLYDVIKSKLDASNAKVKEYQLEYEQLYSNLKYLEAKLRSVSSEKEAQWARIEYETKRSEFRTFEEMRDREHFKAERFANLLNDLVDAYLELFPKYFQEVYDADMHEVSAGPYDDSPAGFRLLYKHGRANTAQWSLIHTPQEYIEALSSFFIASETEIKNSPKFEGLEDEISEIITKIVIHIKTEEFLITAFRRMAKAHNTPLIKNPLENLDKIDKKPWSYTSGGAMTNLVSCYFRLEKRPEEVGRWVENEMELLVFFIDTLKQIPPKLTEDYLKEPNKNMLVHSPTHAFNFKPGFETIKCAWQSDVFTHTWVRDKLVLPRERFVEYLFLDDEMKDFLIEKLLEVVPLNYKHNFRNAFSRWHGKMNPREFRSYLVDTMEGNRGLNYAGQTIVSPDAIDNLLYTDLPLFPFNELKNRLEKILHSIPSIGKQDHAALNSLLDHLIDRWKGPSLVTAKQLKDFAKAAVILLKNETSSSEDYHLLIAKEASKLGFAMPTPIIFADTNWVKEYFAFLVSPGSSKLELWRVDYTGSSGYPMSMWKEWLNGSRKDIPWGLYVRPYEYMTAFSNGF